MKKQFRKVIKFKNYKKSSSSLKHAFFWWDGVLMSKLTSTPIDHGSEEGQEAAISLDEVITGDFEEGDPEIEFFINGNLIAKENISEYYDLVLSIQSNSLMQDDINLLY